MTTVASTKNLKTTRFSSLGALNRSAEIWFVVAVIGHGLFAYYIMAGYGRLAVSGDSATANEILPTGIISGDLIGNLFLIAHLSLAFVITFGGPLQILPQLRKRAMGFHRWNGRIYIITAIVISIAGLYLTYFRESPIAGILNQLGITLNAALIMICTVMTIRSARSHDVTKHRRWALRTFLMVAGVWFMRLGYGFWIFIHNGMPPGITSDLQGPFDIFLAFANSLLPLAFLELYFYAQNRGSAMTRWVVSVVIIGLAIATGIGIFMALQIFWLPRL
ncbi:MAG: DUF2306 domain-containing protein [Marinoscillum sp.]